MNDVSYALLCVFALVLSSRLAKSTTYQGRAGLDCCLLKGHRRYHRLRVRLSNHAAQSSLLVVERRL